MVYAFNTIYVAAFNSRGLLLTSKPAKAIWSEKKDRWVNRKLGIEVEFIGLILSAGDVGRVFSSPKFEEVEKYILENTQVLV